MKYSVKLTWLILCNVGTFFSWFVLWAMSKAMNNHWIPMTYGASLTSLVFAFDIGTIWRMNPYEFPTWFCIMQMFMVNLSVFVLVGVCTAYYMATIVSVLWPERNPTKA